MMPLWWTAFLLLLLHVPASLSFSSSSSDPNTGPWIDNNSSIRLNKVFKETHSRRKADMLIERGRVKVNGDVVRDMGRKVIPYVDCVELDNIPYLGWEASNHHHHRWTVVDASSSSVASTTATAVDSIHRTDEATNYRQKQQQDSVLPVSSSTSATPATTYYMDEYIKYWKPVGVTCTTDPTVPGNLLEALQPRQRRRRHDHDDNDTDAPQTPIRNRIFSVGRLDKDSSGLLLLTSDGRLPNAVLRKQFKRPKTYVVRVDPPITQHHMELLRRGVVISTDTVRQGKHRSVTARTLPCRVVPHQARGNNANDDACPVIEITLEEGRNRQIRVMLDTVGRYRVLELHRTEFMGITLSRLHRPGEWTRLDSGELAIVQRAITTAAAASFAESATRDEEE
jgi:23S rRNA pseudouridine2604 synthase